MYIYIYKKGTFSYFKTESGFFSFTILIDLKIKIVNLIEIFSFNIY